MASLMQRTLPGATSYYQLIDESGQDYQPMWDADARVHAHIHEAQLVLQILRKSDYASDTKTIPPWMRGTCEWILDEQQYQVWKEGRKSSFLWISGKPGCGKTVLASYLVERLRSIASQNELPCLVCCFFFNANNKDYKNFSIALSSLLYQLLVSMKQDARDNQLNKYVVPEYRSQGEAFMNQASILWRIIASIVSDPDCGNVICIIDGLSDCGDSRVSFINSLARFFSEHGSVENESGFLKIIATTRYDIESSSSYLKRLKMVNMKSLVFAPEKDIEGYAEVRAQKILLEKGLSRDLLSSSMKVLIQNRKNTLLSTSLVLDWLENVKNNDQKKLLERTSWALSNANDEVNSIYEISLCECPDRLITKKLLQIVAVAAEPLTLEEINVAMKVKCGAEIENTRCEDINESTIKQYCGILLRVLDSRVIFVHRTARKFLLNPHQHGTKSPEKWEQSLSLVEANETLADICISHLLKPVFYLSPTLNTENVSVPDFEQRIRAYVSKYPLLEYAAKHWAGHFEAATEPNRLLGNALTLYEPLSGQARMWFQVYWISTHATKLPPKGITNLMVASHFGHLSVLQELKEQKDKVDIKATDENGWTALHWSSQVETLEIAKVLLDLGADIDAESKSKRTPLDCAAGKGYETLVRLFLKRREENTSNPTAIDKKASSKAKVAVMPENRRSSVYLGDDGVRSLMLFEAAQEGNETLVGRLLDQGTRANQTHNRNWTALHVAASQNFPSIVSLLLEKGRADVDKRNEDGKTALALATENGHENVVKVLLRRGANTGKYDPGVNTAFNLASKSIKTLLNRPPIVRGPSLIPRPLSPPPLIPDTLQQKDESHSSHDFNATILDLWFTEESLHEHRSSFANPTVHDVLYDNGPYKIMKQYERDPPHNAATFRWIHLPANNMIWVKHLVTRIYHERIIRHGETPASHFETKLKRVDRLFDSSQQYRAPKDAATHARFFRPSCRSINIGEYSQVCKSTSTEPKTFLTQVSEAKVLKTDATKDNPAIKEKDIVLFMPFLHYETNDGRNCMAKAIEKAMENKDDQKPVDRGKQTADEKLIHTYLHEKHFMHIRRTLDQYYYHTMKDTSLRDEDQVVYRYAKKMWPDEKETNLNILMVDQLWMWILDGDTVITSFPRRWNRKQSEDDLDVVESIRKHINVREGRDPLRSAYDLAVLIASFCSEVFFEREDDPEPLDEKLQFMEFFDKSIGDVTANETACFNRLANFFKDLDNTSREKEGYFIDAMEKEVQDDRIEGSIALNTDKPYDVFYNIGEEAALLREIKDIRDELNIITKVFTDQQKALEMMNKLVKGKVNSTGKEPSADIIKRIKRHMADIKEIDDHASRTYEALNHLLDLKQKHANVCEARWTREQAQETAKQRNTIMVFTIVTIIFLPLSFMAAFLALQIVQFPKDPTTGALALELNFVAKYLLGISAAIIVPFLLIAFNVNRINIWIAEKFGLIMETNFGILVLGYLGHRFQEKRELLIRKRENRLKRQDERSKGKRTPPKLDRSVNPSIDLPIEEKNNEVAVESILTGGNYRVMSWNSNDILSGRRRKPTADLENQDSVFDRAKSKTFPVYQKTEHSPEVGRSPEL